MLAKEFAEMALTIDNWYSTSPRLKKATFVVFASDITLAVQAIPF